MDPGRKRTLHRLLPWATIFAALGVLAFIGFLRRDHPTPFETHWQKLDLLSRMRGHLHAAVEAEKHAVLAVTDEASEDFASRARQAADAVESRRKELEAVLREQAPSETEILDEFNACWMQFRELDEAILGLAVQNTNLKAQRISSTQCAEEIASFEASLRRLVEQNTDEDRCVVVSASYEALVAALKTFALHKPHIEATADPEMDRLEQHLRTHHESARKALESLRGLPDLAGREDLKTAEAAYERFMSLTGEVVRLSRLNTNIRSAELSLGKQRLVSAKCQEILGALHEGVRDQQFSGSR